MIDPKNIQIQNSNLSSTINVQKVNPFEGECYDLNDDKDYERYIKDVEKCVRHSYEYRKFINFLKNNMGMNKCAFFKGVSNAETYDIKIELHHYPFTLRDIVEIVYRKRAYYKEYISVFMVAKEVMELHYKMIIGLIPLSETVHQLVHSGRLFIPIDKVSGRYEIFVDLYQPFIEPDLLDSLELIEKATYEHSDVNDTTIIDQNRVTYDIKDNRYKLPEIKQITDNMYDQIRAIKDNNFLLPNINDKKENSNFLNLNELVNVRYPVPTEPVEWL